MNRVGLCIIMVLLIAIIVGADGLEPTFLAILNLLVLCFTTSIWGKVVLFICGVLTVVFFIGE